MATSQAGLTVIDTLVQDLKEKETLKEKKANTVTTALGSVVTIALTGAAAWVESGSDLPSWLPFLVGILGLLGTTYGVSQTKNGVTQSLADKLHDEIAARIDANHFHEPELPETDAIDPPEINLLDPMGTTTAQLDAEYLRSSAESIVKEIR